MIAIFQPVNNWPWFDIREFQIKDWKPSTYKWLKVDYTKKRRSDMIIEQKIPEMYIEPIKLEAEKWDSNHWATREMTSWNFQQIIDKYYNPN